MCRGGESGGLNRPFELPAGLGARSRENSAARDSFVRGVPKRIDESSRDPSDEIEGVDTLDAAYPGRWRSQGGMAMAFSRGDEEPLDDVHDEARLDDEDVAEATDEDGDWYR